ncbi:MAG: DsbA family oxidoreductase [Chloroflexota bacterium]
MRIDVFHDIACPWCRIGKAHLAQALEQWDTTPVEVHYHPFLLNANIPEDGANFRDYMLAKGGHRIALEQFFDAPRQMGAQAGITFNFEAIEHAPNTINAHRLISFVSESDQPTLIDALYKAYFEDGRNVGSLTVLADIAHDCGHDRDAILARLQSDDNRAEVLQQVTEAQRLGVTGVPFFVVNSMFAFSGAQPPQTILNVLKQARGEITT